MKVYLVGSLRNPKIPSIANKIRELGYEVFDDWISPGPETDDKWQEYEKTRGRSYKEALAGDHARNVFKFDLKHLENADIVIMVIPCGKSGHLELGWAIGQGKKGYVLFDEEPERYDIMYAFCTDIFFSLDDLCSGLAADRSHEAIKKLESVLIEKGMESFNGS